MKTKSTTRLMPCSRSSRREGGEFGHGAERRVHVAVAADRVAAVAVPLRGAEQRHQVQVGQAELPEVRDAGAEPGQVAGEEVDVADPAQHPVGLEPVRVRLAGRVEGLQVRRPLLPGRRGVEDQLPQFGVAVGP